jgi:hypothetical protein
MPDMPRKRTITHGAVKKAMTLDELAAFIHDAKRAGASGSETAKVRVNFGGTIKKIEVALRAYIVNDAALETDTPA